MKRSLPRRINSANLVAMIFAVAILISASLAPPFTKTANAQENDPSEARALKDLWMDLSIGGPLLDTFNRSARSEDIARVEHISQIDLLESVTVGQRLVVFRSSADAERLLPHIHDKIDIIGYNLEHGPANPSTEQADPVGSIKKLRQAADEYGLRIALGPDHRFALSHAAEMAPYADILVLQIQRVQTEPDSVYEFVLPLVSSLRQANPDIEISVQIRTEGDVEELLELIAPLQDDLDGISILTSVETVPFAKELVKELRGPASTTSPADGLAENSELPQNDRITSAPELQNSTGWRWVLAFILGIVVFAFGIGFLGHRAESGQGE